MRFVGCVAFMLLSCLVCSVCNADTPGGVPFQDNDGGAAALSWNGYLLAEEPKTIRIEVYDPSYMHMKLIGGKLEPAVAFLVFHDDRSGWGNAIQNAAIEMFAGPGGYVEKAHIPLNMENGKWVGEVVIVPSESIRQVELWRLPDSSTGGHVGVSVSVSNGSQAVIALSERQPSLQEVVGAIRTPEQLLQFMNLYFTVQYRAGHVPYTPEEFLHARNGDCKDWAEFAKRILIGSGYEAATLTYSTGNPYGHVVTVYWIESRIYYLTIRLTDAAIYGPFVSITQVLEHEIDRRPDLRPGERVYYRLCDPESSILPPIDKSQYID